MTAKHLGDLFHEVGNAVAFTGAGISTESGIPDFRSPTGIWTKMQPIDFRDFVASADMRIESWRRRFVAEETLAKAEPNKGHLAVARLVDRGIVSMVITQNVDGLHQAAGVDEHRVIEIHGNSTYAKCLDCATRYELDDIRAVFEETGTPPNCEDCGGLIKTATISFGQAMPEVEMARAQEASLACDLFVAIGSSLVVYPAAGLPRLAKENGAKLVILNREPTDLDPMADLVIHAEIGPTLSAALGDT